MSGGLQRHMAAFWLKGCYDGDPRIHSHVKIKGLGETGELGKGGREAWRMARKEWNTALSRVWSSRSTVSTGVHYWIIEIMCATYIAPQSGEGLQSTYQLLLISPPSPPAFPFLLICIYLISVE
jgi:hypothetical protein